jgi:hypothetical protein
MVIPAAVAVAETSMLNCVGLSRYARNKTHDMISAAAGNRQRKRVIFT